MGNSNGHRWAVPLTAHGQILLTLDSGSVDVRPHGQLPRVAFLLNGPVNAFALALVGLLGMSARRGATLTPKGTWRLADGTANKTARDC